jgi:hypothetical protein
MECDNVVDMHKTISNFNQQVKLWHTPQLPLNFYPAKQIIREDLKLSNRLWEATNQTVGREIHGVNIFQMANINFFLMEGTPPALFIS